MVARHSRAVPRFRRAQTRRHQTSGMKFGVAAGSSAVMSPGLQLCRRDATEMLFEQMRTPMTPSFAVMTNRQAAVEV